MANETSTAVQTAQTTANTDKKDCGCGGQTTGVQAHGDNDDCPCKRRAKIKKMLIGGVILIVLGVAAYSAWKMGYFEKAINFVKTKVKKIG